MPAPGVRYGPVFSEAMEIPFNQPHQHGPELDYIRDAIQRAHLCGDGYYTKKCHELLAAVSYTHLTLPTNSLV